ELVQEIGSPGFFQAPGISADGRYLAYARENEAGGSSVVVANADGEIIMQEQHAGMTAMSWHPAANQLAFISATRNNGRFFGPLRLIDVDKGEVDLLTNETVLAFFWSPDGRYLAIIHVGILNGNEEIAQKENRAHLSKPVAQRFQLPELTLAILDVDSRTTVQSLTFQPTERFFTQFLPFFDQYALSHRLWSPQSDAVALPMRVDDNPQVVVISVADGRQQTIGEGDMPFWSP
ncbi:MAG: TolB family protein, partial [Anaerolineae bacterium]